MYNNNAEISIPFNGGGSHDSFKKAVQAIAHNKQPSNIFKAIETARQFLIPTRNTALPTILVVLTNDENQRLLDLEKLTTTIQALRSSRVAIIAVSFSQIGPSDTVKSIADSRSNLFHTIDAKKFVEAEFVSALARRICTLGKACFWHIKVFC